MRVLIAGAGQTAYSVARWLTLEGMVFDFFLESPQQRVALAAQFPGSRIFGPNEVAQGLQGATCLCVSPGIPWSTPLIQQALAQGLPVWGDIELFAQAWLQRGLGADAKCLAVTGSNGKTTTVSLVAHLCRSHGVKVIAAGNIGLPVLDALRQCVLSQCWPQVWVLELSSFQLQSTYSLHVDAASILNLSEDHLDWHGSWAAYVAAKQRLWQFSKQCIFNRDDLNTVPQGQDQAISFGSDCPKRDSDFGIRTQSKARFYARGTQSLGNCQAYPALCGAHNDLNVLAALMLCEAAGYEALSCVPYLGDFQRLPSRIEKVLQWGKIGFYDDSKGTNVAATCAAVATFNGPLILMVGGVSKAQNFSKLAQKVAKNCVQLVVFGRDRLEISQAMGDISHQVVDDLQAAVQCAYDWACQRPADILLSPACASFDAFKNYQHRSEVYRALVTTITESAQTDDSQ